MKALGAAASITTIIKLSAKIASLCIQYSLAVKGAKNDITRLETEIKNLEKMIDNVQNLISDSDEVKLSASQKLLEVVHDCFV